MRRCSPAAAITRSVALCLTTGALASALLCGCAQRQTADSDSLEPSRAASQTDPIVNRQVRPAYDPARIFDASHASPAGHGEMPAEPESPSMRMYGDVPSTATGRMSHGLTFDGAENLRRVSFASDGADFDPVLSPDGAWLYFASTRHRATADLYVKRIDGQAVTQLTSDPANDVMPALSPDGTRIAFASNRGGSWDIYVMNAAGGQAVQVTSDSGDELHPSWGPSGRELVYCRLGADDDRWQIWHSDVSRPGVHTFLTYGLFPQWQPEGNAILFQRSRDRGDRAFALWTVTLAGGEAVSPTEVASSPAAALINPAWSADGSRIAFAAVPLTGDEGNSPRPAVADIWVMNADGTGKTNLTAGAYVNLSPAWGPTDEVYFVSDRAGADSIWRLGSSQAALAADVLNSPGVTDFAAAGGDAAGVVTSADESDSDN